MFSYQKHSVNFGWIDWICIVLVLCIKLARQLDNHLEVGTWSCPCIYSVAKAVLGVYDHMGELKEWAA